MAQQPGQDDGAHCPFPQCDMDPVAVHVQGRCPEGLQATSWKDHQRSSTQGISGAHDKILSLSQ